MKKVFEREPVENDAPEWWKDIINEYEQSLHKEVWTLSQAVHLIFGRPYPFQPVNDKEKYFPDASFFFSAIEAIDEKKSLCRREAELYLKADRCIKAGTLCGKWSEGEHDYRLKRQDFLKWAINLDIDIHHTIYLNIEILTKKNWNNCKQQVISLANEFLDTCQQKVPNDEIIRFVRSKLDVINIDDKTLRNYIGTISHPFKSQKGRPRKLPDL